LPLRDARAGLEAIASKLKERDDGLVELKRRPPTAPLPKPRLLGSFEPVLLGWKSRELLLGEAEPLVVSGGVFRPFALVEDVPSRPGLSPVRRSNSSPSLGLLARTAKRSRPMRATWRAFSATEPRFCIPLPLLAEPLG
jgi:hypothetical protein